MSEITQGFIAGYVLGACMLAAILLLMRRNTR